MTIFNWNNKYILKVETSSLEQTYKIDQYDLSSDEEVINLLDSVFIQQVTERFNQMAIDLTMAMNRLQN